MATQTATLRFSKPTTGGDLGPLWGNYYNGDFDIVDKAINQTLVINVPDANVTLVADGTAADQAVYAVLQFSGTTTSTRTVTLPNCQRQGAAINATSGGNGIILSTGAGASATLPDDGNKYAYSVDASGNVT